MKTIAQDFAASVEFEECLVGSILLDPDAIDIVAADITGRDFFDADLGKFFSLLVMLHESGQPISDIKIVSAEAKKSNITIDAGRIAILFTDVPSARHLEHYVAKVKEHSRKRQLHVIGTEMIRSACDLQQPSDAIIGSVQHRIESISMRSTTGSKTIDEVGVEFLAELSEPKKKTTTMMGLPSVDNLVGGFKPGEMIVIAARPGNGKTSLGWQIAEHSFRKLRRVLFVSLEMKRTELFQRVVCGITGINSRRIRRNELTGAERATIADAVESLEGFPVSILDPPTATIAQVQAEAKLCQSRDGLDLLVIDFMGLVAAANPKSPRYEQATEDSKAIKRLAKELNVPVLALCQLNRQAADSAPKLSHLRDSGSIEQDADIVLMLHREEEGSNDFKLIVAKHRHGEVGQVSLSFDAPRTRFTELF